MNNSKLDIKKRALQMIGALYDNNELSDLNVIFTLDACSDEDNAVIHMSECDLGPAEYMLMLDLLRDYFKVDPSICLMAIDSEYNKIIIQR
jgi:hypothetical protein